MSKEEKSEQKFAIRFGLGAIKAVGFAMMENTVSERKKNNKFADIYDFSERMDPRAINKKSIEALAKSGAFDSLQQNRRQLAESFEILSAYSVEKHDKIASNQMNLFGALAENSKPELKKISDWNKIERLQKEFEAFGFFLNEHPLDDQVSELKKRGIIFSDKLERDELEDGDSIKMAGVIASSKHRSSARGRFAYLTISDPYGIFEAMIFDEALITAARDILVDGSQIIIECLIRKDEGGVRISVREVKKLEDFIRSTKAREENFEDIQKQNRQNRDGRNFQRNQNFKKTSDKNEAKPILQTTAKHFVRVEIIIKEVTPILTVKSLLSRLRVPENQNPEKSTKINFLISSDNKFATVELSERYLLQESDIFRLRQIDKVIEVRTYE